MRAQKYSNIQCCHKDKPPFPPPKSEKERLALWNDFKTNLQQISHHNFK